MKIVVFADSHSDVDTMCKATEAENPDMIIHLGDHVKDALELQEIFADIPMEFVKGNTDRAYEYPFEKKILVNDKIFFITHGNQYKVEQGVLDVIDRGVSNDADLISFGHTHKRYLKNHEGVWVMNPGRIGRKSSKIVHATYGRVILDSDMVFCEIVECESI
jgi:putative phosphoesterase